MAGEAPARVRRRGSLDNSRGSDKDNNSQGKSTSTSNVSSAPRSRPVVRRSKTGDSRIRPMPIARGVNRAKSGSDRAAMMSQRAMSSRDFGSRPGRGLAMARNGGAGRGLPNRSMSSRFMDAASELSRMASTRALFIDEPEEDPSIIVYLGREIKASDHFEDDWIEDALDDEAGGKKLDESSRMSQSSRRRNSSIANLDNGSKRRSSTNDIKDSFQNTVSSGIKKDNGDEDDEESEVEEEMEEFEEDSSATPKRRGRRGVGTAKNVNSPKRRSQSTEPGSKTPPPAPKQRGVARCRTFDGRKTSEILPRRRKAKYRASRNSVKIKQDLSQQFQKFLSKTGGVTPTGNHLYQNCQTVTVEEILMQRRKARMPRSRKKIEQFRRLAYTAEDIQDVLCEDDETFQRLKRVLTKKGAITNGVLQQRLHIFLKKAKDRLRKRKEEEAGEDDYDEDDEADTGTHWAAMSMMDMFAHSVRKLTTDTESPSAATAATPAADGGEPKFQRRALPRMQAIQQKRMQAANAKKGTRSLMGSFDEDEDEESTHRDASDKLESARKGEEPASPFCHRKPPARPVRSSSKGSAPLLSNSKSESFSDDDVKLDTNLMEPKDLLEPKELPATGSPMRLDLTTDFKETLPKELPASQSPIKLDLTQNFSDAPIEPKELPTSQSPIKLDLTQKFNESPIEPRELPASQSPINLDLNQGFQEELTMQPRCLDDELSPRRSPMKLDLNQGFTGELSIEPKCLDDEKANNKPMKLDLSIGTSSGREDPVMFTPKNLDESSKKDESKNMIDSKMDGSRARRRTKPSRIRRNLSGSSTGSGSATPTRRRARRTKSSDEVMPPAKLQIKCLDDPKPPPSVTRRNSLGSTKNGSSGEPAPPGLLVGWNH